MNKHAETKKHTSKQSNHRQSDPRPPKTKHKRLAQERGVCRTSGLCPFLLYNSKWGTKQNRKTSSIVRQPHPFCPPFGLPSYPVHIEWFPSIIPPSSTLLRTRTPPDRFPSVPGAKMKVKRCTSSMAPRRSVSWPSKPWGDHGVAKTMEAW